MKKIRNKRKIQAELECRYWDLTGELPYPRFSWYHRGYSLYLENLALEIAEMERHMLGNSTYDPGP